MPPFDPTQRKDLIESNMGLVKKVASRYRFSGVPFEDLVQEGIIGLIHAIDQFDHTKDCRLSTFAKPWIQHRIERAVWHGSSMNGLSHRDFQSLSQMEAVEERLWKELCRNVSVEELAVEMAIYPQKVKFLKRVMEKELSLDEPLTDDTLDTLSDIIADEQADEPTLTLQARESEEVLGAALKRLPARQQRVLTLRFGLDGEGQRTYQEIASDLAVSVSRVKQIEKKGLGLLQELMCEQDNPRR